MGKSWLASLLVLWLGTMPAHAADDPLERLVGGQRFDQFVQAALRDYDVPGAVVVVASARGVVFLKGYGVRRHGTPEPVDEDTRFQIASVSKFIAATSIGTVVERGVAGWDQPVRQFAPGVGLAVPYASEQATLRDFLAHRTGLPAYAGDLLTKLGYPTDEILRRAQFLPFARSFRAQWAYSNLGIFLGQAAAARAAGLTPAELLQSGMLGPVGMARSGPVRAELFKDGNRAAGHDLDLAVMAYDDVDAFSGAGAIVSTGADLARWMRMLLGKGVLDGRRILAEATVEAIFAPSMVQGTGGPLGDPNDSAGLGCESYQFLGTRVIEKNGALDGVRSIVTLVPGRDIGIAVLANKHLTVFPEAVRAEFLERVLGPTGRDLQAQVKAEQPAWHAFGALPKPPGDAVPPKHRLDAYAGQYASRLYGDLAVTRAGDGFELRVGPGGYRGRLSPWSGDTFLATFQDRDITPALVTFTFAGGETPTGLDGADLPLPPGGQIGRFDRVPP